MRSEAHRSPSSRADDPGDARLPPDYHGAVSTIRRDGSSTRIMAALDHAPAPGGHQAIAVVGLACRLPGGATSPDRFWDLLRSGEETSVEIPADRWDVDAYYSASPGAPGKMCTRRAHLLERVDTFDPLFFGISPREASQMDPQQRLLLELAWEGVEDAGIAPPSLAGSKTGVFVGVMWSDYRLLGAEDSSRLTLHSGTGAAPGVVANRVSYVMGLRGPSLAVDTACSSSLVAIHLACQSLRAGESTLALVGGVNLLLSPATMVAMSSFGALSADGRCKAFDARADGYGRGEGGAVLVLKPLEQARADHDRIHCVIHGSAVNQDGRSEGLSAPDPLAQAAVLREAYEAATIRPAQVQYVEAHGAGTALGDRSEAEALGAVFASGRAARLPVGSVKTNIGHLEAAAGIAGVVKVALSMAHRQLPPSLHFETPAVDLDRLGLDVATELRDWGRTDEPLLAGVSSFGWGGTNAHVVVGSEARQTASSDAGPHAASPDDAGGPAQLLVLSAHTPRALRQRATQLARHLADHPEVPLVDLCRTTSAGRAHLPHRLAAVVTTSPDLRRELAAHGADEPCQVLVKDPSAPTRPGSAGGVAFVVSGAGSNWVGMGRSLLREEPRFARALAACDAALAPHLGWSVLARLSAGQDDTLPMDRSDVAQPTLFALSVALSDLWRAWGVAPDAVVGHSQGEIAAAAIAGILSLDDAALLISRRSQLLRRIAGQGAMAVVGLPAGQTAARLDRLQGGLSVAAIDSRSATVVSGSPDAVDSLLEGLDAEGVFCRRVQVDIASHSQQVEPLRDDLISALASLNPRAGTIPFYSTVTGGVVDGPSLGASYWFDNLRNPVRFARTMQRLLDDGYRSFVETSPHPLLAHAMTSALETASATGVVVPSLRRGEGSRAQVLAALGALYVAGAPVDWERHHGGRRRPVSLPPYPFQRERYWLSPSQASRPVGHVAGPLGTHVESSLEPGTHFFDSVLDLATAPALGAHRLESTAVVSAGLLLDWALAGVERSRNDAARLVDVALESPVVVEPGVRRAAQLVVRGEDWRLSTRRETGEFRLHAQGGLAAAADPGADASESWRELTEAAPTSRQAHYDGLAARGIHYDDPYRSIHALYRGRGRALASLMPEPSRAQALDACLQTLLATWDRPGASVVSGIGSVELRGRPARAAWAYATAPRGGSVGDVTLLGPDGAVLARLAGVMLSPPPVPLWTEGWAPDAEPASGGDAATRWLLVGGPEPLAAALSDALGEGAARAARLDSALPSSPDEARTVVLLDGAALDVDDDPLESLADECGRLIGARQARTLVVVTRRGVHVAGTDPTVVPASAALHALARAVTVERAGPTVRVVDIDEARPTETHLALARELRRACSDERVAIRHGRRHLPQRVGWRGARGELRSARGAVLITGGLGALGLSVARWTADQGASDLVLVGRSAPGASARAVIEALQARGTRVEAVQADVAHRPAVAELLATLARQGRRLSSVFHVAGVVEDAVLGDTDGDRLRRVLAPKVSGGWNLHLLTQELGLDHFVLFGSVAAWRAIPGQGAYAAANGFLDGLAEHRRALGQPALSIGWCGWRGLGLAATSGGREALATLEERGVGPVSESEALALLGRLLSADPPARVVVLPPARPPATPARRGSAEGGELRRELRAAGSPGRRRARVTELVQTALAAALQLPARRIDPERPFRELGLESLMAVELVETLSRRLDLRLPRLATWQHPTLATLAAFIDAELERSDAARGDGEGT